MPEVRVERTDEMIEWWWLLITAVVSSGLTIFLMGSMTSGSNADDQSESFWAGVDYEYKRLTKRDEGSQA